MPQAASHLFNSRKMIAGMAGLALLGAIALQPSTARGALAALNGGSALSGTLSSNKAVRKQQLICDPAPGSGSMTVSYDPSLVSLTNYEYGPGYYQGDGLAGYVEVANNPGTPSLRVGNISVAPTYLVSLTTYLQNTANYVQVGNVQVFFAITEGGVPGHLDPTQPLLYYDGSFTVVDQDGPSGPDDADTHLLEFTLLPGTSDSQNISYTIYAAQAGTYGTSSNGGNSADYLTDSTDPNGTEIPASDITPATVSGPVPEPTTLALLIPAVGALLLRRRRVASIPL